MADNNDAYAQRGVSSSKAEVHEAAKIFDEGLFSNSFCKVLPDTLTTSEDHCIVMHADGTGSKSILPYIHWKETGYLKWFKTIPHDALVMNLDDMGAAGFTDHFIINSTIDRNKNRIPQEVLSTIMKGTQEFIETMAEHGITITHSGGETADLGDVVRTYTCNFSIVARAWRDEVININIKPGDEVLGLSSYGMCSYDKLLNSGIGSNGLTNARHDILSPLYKEKYPECFDRESVEYGTIDKKLMYCGKYKIEDPAAQMLIHPTRTYLPVLQAIKKEGLMKRLSGIIHNTGGGQGKVLKFTQGVHISKKFDKNLPEVFRLIQETRNEPWKDMFTTFNMGSRMEFYGDPSVLNEVGAIANELGVTPVMDGKVTAGNNEVRICHKDIEVDKPIILK